MIKALFKKNKTGFSEKSRLTRFEYSPGYSDMRGARHEEVLKRDKNGWITVCRDRECHGEPVVVTTWAVSDAAAEDFFRFLCENDVPSLSLRKEDDLFATDYSPWEYSIEFENPSTSDAGRRYLRICEYRKYSKRDYELLRELKDRFRALRGEKISETVEAE